MTNTYSDRIIARMKELGLTQGDVSKATGAARSTVHGWLNNVAQPSGQRLLLLATTLQTTAEWILNGKSFPQIENMNYRPPVDNDDAPARLTPVISWVQAGDFTAVVSADLAHVIEWIPYNPRSGPHGFALIVKGASMEPEFRASEYVYINPTYQIDELNTGALVVMACDGDTEATFKELVAEGGKYYLRALNPDWHEKIMPVDHNCRLVGKVVGKYVNY